MLNTDIGPYRILREVGGNGLGDSYEAVDRGTSRKVVLRYFRRESLTEEIRARLYSEAKTLALLTHANIARVFGFIRRDDNLYLVTEFLEGQTLETILKERRKMPPAMAVSLFHQMLAGVAFAHRLGVIHGDLKPSNVLVPDYGPIKLLDVGVAHILRDLRVTAAEANTSRYKSPEQLAGAFGDVRSDIYSLGMVLYEMLVGKGPFDLYGDEARRTTAALIPAPPSLSDLEIPPSLVDLVLRALAVSPSHRFQSTKAMGQALEAAMAPRTRKARLTTVRLWCRQKVGSAAGSLSFCVSSTRNRIVDAIKTAALGTSSATRGSFAGVHSLLNASTNTVAANRVRVVQKIRSTSAYFSPTLKQLRDLSKDILPHTVKGDWKRYVRATSLVLLIAVECFYFRGAHISLILDSRLMSNPLLGDEVDAMFARLNQQGSDTEPRELATTELRPIVDLQESRRELPRKPIASPAISARPEEPLPRLPMDKERRSPLLAASAERQTREPAAPAPHANESKISEPVRTTHNFTRKRELDVKWEN